MTVRRAVLLCLLAYVSLDLANPMMAGAFRFDPDQSVEAVRAARSAPLTPVVLRTSAPALAADLDRDPAVRVARPRPPVNARAARESVAPPPHSGSFAEPPSPED